MTLLAAPRAPRSKMALRARPAILLGIAGGTIGFLGSWNPSYWGDEAASVMSATRSWPSLAAELGVIDGVHGVYYAFLHLWASVFGISELATRLPSAIASGFMVAGTVVLVRSLSTTKFAVAAAVVLMVLPRATLMAAEARSYAMGAAVAVWLTVLFVRLTRGQSSPRLWMLYGIAMGASVYLFLYLGLMLLVHGFVVLVLFRSSLRAWGRGALIASCIAAPMVVIGYLQRGQVSFLAHRNYATASNVLANQWFGTPTVAIACWALVLASVVWFATRIARRLPPDREHLILATIVLSWLIVPTALLLLGNALISPMYNVRYLSFSTPAAAIAVAAGAVLLGRGVSRAVTASGRRRALGAALTITVIGTVLALTVPSYLTQRTPWAKDGGSDWRQVADYVAANAGTGDTIVFDQTTKPSRDPRAALYLYPSQFAAVHDVALLTAYNERAGLWDEVAPIRDLAPQLRSTHDVWAVELVKGSTVPVDVSYLENLGFTVDSATLIHRTTVYHLTQE